jgi:twitching motility protein PilT
LRGVIAQTLFRKADGKGRVAAVEVLINTPAISNLIREGKTFQIPSIMQTGKGLGMLNFENCLADLVASGKVSPDDAAKFLGKAKVTTPGGGSGGSGSSSSTPKPILPGTSTNIKKTG